MLEGSFNAANKKEAMSRTMLQVENCYLNANADYLEDEKMDSEDAIFIKLNQAIVKKEMEWMRKVQKWSKLNSHDQKALENAEREHMLWTLKGLEIPLHQMIA